MEWLNIHTSTIDSEEFVGAEPSERATWICLLRYCVGQENGGVIADCGRWKDRKWQQVVKVTKAEINAECDLWTVEKGNLIVSFYPTDSEDKVRKNRANGAKGGRPRKTNNHMVSANNHMVSKKPKEVATDNHVVSGNLNKETIKSEESFNQDKNNHVVRNTKPSGSSEVTICPPICPQNQKRKERVKEGNLQKERPQQPQQPPASADLDERVSRLLKAAGIKTPVTSLTTDTMIGFSNFAALRDDELLDALSAHLPKFIRERKSKFVYTVEYLLKDLPTRLEEALSGHEAKPKYKVVGRVST